VADFRLFAHHRLGAVPRHRRFRGAYFFVTWRMSRAWSPPASIRPGALADVVTRPRTRPWRSGALDPGAAARRSAQEFNSMVFPGTQAAADACDRRQAVAFLEALQRSSSLLRKCHERAVMTRFCRSAATRLYRRHRQSSVLLDLIDKTSPARMPMRHWAART